MKWIMPVIISAVVGLFGIFSWVADKVDKKMEKIETKTEVNKEEIDQEENINIDQSSAIQQIQDNQRLFI